MTTTGLDMTSAFLLTTGYWLLTSVYCDSDDGHVVVLQPPGGTLAPDEFGEGAIFRCGEPRIKSFGLWVAPRARFEVPGREFLGHEQESVAGLGASFALDEARERRLAQGFARRHERRGRAGLFGLGGREGREQVR